MPTQLDPTLAALLADVPAPDIGNQSLEDIRAQGEAGAIALGAGAPVVHATEDVVVPGPEGDVQLRIYRPRAEQGLPVLVFVHGGGWAAGSLAAIDPTARRLCRGLDCVVASVTYRLAPEHPFPAAFEDVLAATRWVLDHIDDHGGDPHRVAIGGDSAGGNLAAAVTGALHDAADNRIAAQLLLYPALDLDPDARPTASWQADADPTLPAATVRWCIENYVPGGALGDPRVSPARREDLSGLPAAVVAIAPADPLYDEARAYVERLRAAGVPADFLDCVGLVHGFANFVDVVPAAASAFNETMTRFRLLHAGIRT